MTVWTWAWAATLAGSATFGVLSFWGVWILFYRWADRRLELWLAADAIFPVAEDVAEIDAELPQMTPDWSKR